MRKTFGSTVYKVNVDAGFTCPNRDGTLGVSGCSYCNNNSFRPSSCKPDMSISDQIHKGISHIRKRYRADKFLVYFQPYTNTYAPVEQLETLFREALEAPSVVGLAIGTRPDAIDKAKIQLIESLASDHFMLIEYGLQSVYDKSLDWINRGHDYQAYLRAVDMTRDRGIYIGAHIIVGMPTETREEMLGMTEEISLQRIDFLKVHQLQVVKDTPLADLYQKTPFHTFQYEEYLDFIVDFIERISPDIVFQRLFATAPDDILIAPHWGKHRQQILRDIEKQLDARDTYQGRKYTSQPVPG
jgi:radical SAM protein (TIGR01212 family)